MKRFISILSALLATSSIFAIEKTDTLIQAERVDSIVINQGRTKTSIELYGIDGDKDSNLSFSAVLGENQLVTTKTGQAVKTPKTNKRKKNKKLIVALNDTLDIEYTQKDYGWDAVCGGLGIGFNAALEQPKEMDVEMGKSFNITLLYALGLRYTLPNTHNSISFGLGIDWRNYRMTNVDTRFVPQNENISLGAYPEGVIPKNSRLKLFSLMVPVVWKQHLPLQINKSGYMSLAFGPIVNFNVHGSMKNTWLDSEGNLVMQSTNKINQRKVTVDAFAALYINNWLGVYARFSPMTVLKDDTLKFKSFTTGLIVTF